MFSKLQWSMIIDVYLLLVSLYVVHLFDLCVFALCYQSGANIFTFEDSLCQNIHFDTQFFSYFNYSIWNRISGTLIYGISSTIINNSINVIVFYEDQDIIISRLRIMDWLLNYQLYLSRMGKDSPSYLLFVLSIS